MVSTMHTPPERIRPALIRRLAAKFKTDELTLAQRLAPLSDRGIIAALHLNASRTRAALDAALAECKPLSSLPSGEGQGGVSPVSPGTTPNDHRTLTHDGPIWPQPRAKMRDGDAIIQRMGEDLRRAADESADHTATRDVMRALGWQNWQLDAYGPEAAIAIDDDAEIGRAA